MLVAANGDPSAKPSKSISVAPRISTVYPLTASHQKLQRRRHHRSRRSSTTNYSMIRPSIPLWISSSRPIWIRVISSMGSSFSAVWRESENDVFWWSGYQTLSWIRGFFFSLPDFFHLSWKASLISSIWCHSSPPPPFSEHDAERWKRAGADFVGRFFRIYPGTYISKKRLLTAILSKILFDFFLEREKRFWARLCFLLHFLCTYSTIILIYTIYIHNETQIFMIYL